MSGRWIWLPGVAVAVGAAAATAHGLYEVSVAARVPPGMAWLYPLITDGLALVAYAATTRLAGWAAGYAWGVVVLAAGLSGVGQAAYLAGAAEGVTWQLRAGVGAWPALAAAIVAHLLWLLVSRAHPNEVAGEPANPDPNVDQPEAHQLPTASPAPRPVPSPGPPVSPPAGEDRVAALIEAGAGRRKLARELEISEHEAREMLARARNGTS